MMRLIIGSSLRFRYLVLALGVVLTWFGLVRLRDVPVDVFPEFAPPRVEIQTICLGLSSAEVEQLVSVPLENALNGVPGVDVMRSKSVPQLSSIVLIFKSGVDEIRARQLVSERMALATKTLPTWAAPPFMMPPLYLDQPDHEGRHYFQGQVRDGPVDALLLDDPAAAARSSRRCERRDLGRAAQDASGHG
ncbi:efflux RND transporter permease subunit [Bradyrhizobium sp. TZ2]